MQDWSTLLTAVTALLVAVGAKELLAGWLRKRNGKAQEEATRVKEALESRDKMRDILEKEYTNSRITKEYASQLRRMLIEKGIPVSEIPNWPKER